MHELMERLYKLVGRLLMRRECYISACNTCGRESDRYFPYHGAFLWEREYWQQFQPDECCGQTMAVKRSFDGIGGALYRLPGYKAHDTERFRRLVARMPLK